MLHLLGDINGSPEYSESELTAETAKIGRGATATPREGRVGATMSFTGHTMHFDCYSNHMTRLNQRYINGERWEGNKIVQLDQQQYLCPLSKKLRNSICPIMPTMRSMTFRRNAAPPLGPESIFHLDQRGQDEMLGRWKGIENPHDYALADDGSAGAGGHLHYAYEFVETVRKMVRKAEGAPESYVESGRDFTLAEMAAYTITYMENRYRSMGEKHRENRRARELGNVSFILATIWTIVHSQYHILPKPSDPKTDADMLSKLQSDTWGTLISAFRSGGQASSMQELPDSVSSKQAKSDDSRQPKKQRRDASGSSTPDETDVKMSEEQPDSVSPCQKLLTLSAPNFLVKCVVSHPHSFQIAPTYAESLPLSRQSSSIYGSPSLSPERSPSQSPPRRAPDEKSDMSPPRGPSSPAPRRSVSNRASGRPTKFQTLHAAFQDTEDAINARDTLQEGMLAVYVLHAMKSILAVAFRPVPRMVARSKRDAARSPDMNLFQVIKADFGEPQAAKNAKQRLTRAMLGYLRTGAILHFALGALTADDLKGVLWGSKNDDQEAVALAKLLGLPSPNAMVFGRTGHAAVTALAVAFLDNLRGDDDSSGRSVQPGGVPQTCECNTLQLINLPKTYDQVFYLSHTQLDTSSNLRTSRPATCLLCGKCVTMQRSKGNMSKHAHERHCGSTMYLELHTSCVIAISDGFAAPLSSPYLDENGEEDPDLRRGRRLYLNDERYARLSQIAADGRIMDVVSQRRNRHNIYHRAMENTTRNHF